MFAKTALAIAAIMLAHDFAFASGVADVLERPALISKRARNSVLVDIGLAGNRLVAVGERGIILLSDDQGMTWRQAKVPVSVTLTAVQFPVPEQGWAIGHSGVVLHSSDKGETWTLQLDGRTAAKLSQGQVKDSTNPSSTNPDNNLNQPQAAAKPLGDDSPDKPFLALHFENERAGLILGAYGLAFHTDDGGQTWQSWSDRFENPRALHIYAIRSTPSAIYVAGEQGLMLRSDNRGKSFIHLPVPKKVSYFSMLAGGDGEVVAAGLVGNVIWSHDKGEHWAETNIGGRVSLSAITALKSGNWLLTNQEGSLFVTSDNGKNYQRVPTQQNFPISAAIEVPGHVLVAVGLRGVMRIQLPGNI